MCVCVCACVRAACVRACVSVWLFMCGYIFATIHKANRDGDKIKLSKKKYFTPSCLRWMDGVTAVADPGGGPGEPGPLLWGYVKS